MARLQFKSATKSKGFDPIQLSKASLSEMEKRDAAVLKGLQENHAAEMKQRETNLQAMRENDEYTQRRFRENRQIEVDNLRREQTSLNQIAARDSQQAQYDQQATETIVSSIVDFSESAMKLDLKRKAAKLEEDLKEVDLTPITKDDLYGDDEYTNFTAASNTNIEGSLQFTTKIAKDAVESSEPKYVTNINQVAEKGFNTAQQQKFDQKVFKANFYERKNQLLESGKFLGADRDPAVATALYNKAISDVRTLMRRKLGITNKHYFADTIIDLNEENDVNISNATRNKEQDVKDYSIDRYTEFAKGGTTAQITVSKQKMTKLVGYAATQEWMTNLVINANSLEEIEAIGNVPTDNKELYRKRSANRFNADKATWIANQNKKVSDAQRQRKVNLIQSVNNNIDNIIEGYAKNTPQAMKEVRQLMIEQGDGTLLPVLVAIESAQLKANEDELEALEIKAKKGTLSKADVNNSSYMNRKAASELYTGQQGSIYGESEKAITEGLIATARDITGIVGDGKNSVQTLLVHAQLKRDFLKTKQSAGFENPLAAWEEVKKQVAVDRENPKGKYYKKVENGRISLPGIEKPDKEDAEMFDLAQKKMLSDGTGTVDLPFILDTPQGMDETFKSSTIPGQVPEFSAGIREFALKYGFSFVEVFNRQRMANNAATGENKPLIKNSVFEQIKAPDISNLIFNKHNNKTQSIRGAAQQDRTVIGQRRSSMGGGNPTPQQAYDYMRSLGVSDIHAKGILANIKGESNFETGVRGDNGMSGGLFQMYDDRYRKMEQAVPDWQSNWKGQIQHALQDDIGPQFLNMNFNSPEEAADYFLEYYERPASQHLPGRRQLNRTFIPNLGF